MVTVKDWVRSQFLLAQHLGVEKWCVVIGGSLGGMQAMQWAIDYPDKTRHAVIIAAAAKLTAQNISFNEVARQAIKSDLEFCEGRYIEHGKIPRQGLRLARMLGHITYLSDEGMGTKFGRELYNDKLNYNFNHEFQVESYLNYQGDKFAGTFDADTYLLMTKALDYFDPAAEHEGSLSRALSKTSSKFLVISFSSDWRFAPSRSREIVQALIREKKHVTYVEIETQHGHDSFLMPIPEYFNAFSAYMEQINLGDSHE
jgi:homoserine O-acetyltransferase